MHPLPTSLVTSKVLVLFLFKSELSVYAFGEQQTVIANCQGGEKRDRR